MPRLHPGDIGCVAKLHNTHTNDTLSTKAHPVRLPQIDSRNRVSLDMIVGAQEPAAVIDFLKRLQESPLFGPMTLHSTQPPTQNEPLYRYRVSVNYAQKL